MGPGESTTNIAHGGIYSLYRSSATGVLFMAVWNGILKSEDGGVIWQTFTTGLPYASYESLIGDGVNLYTAPSFPVGGDNSQTHGPWYTVAESGGTAWSALNGQAPCTNNVCNGPLTQHWTHPTGPSTQLTGMRACGYSNGSGGCAHANTGPSSGPTDVPAEEVD